MKLRERDGMAPIDKMCLAAGISRQELADRSGVPYITLDQWARRVRTPRDVYQLRKVARATFRSWYTSRGVLTRLAH